MAKLIEALPAEELYDVRRIVLLWIGRLGDFLITTPVLRSIRRRFPEAHITIIAGTKNSDVAALCPDVDERLTLHPIQGALPNARAALRLLLRPADMLVELNTSYSRSSTFLARLARARMKIAFQRSSGNGPYTHLLAPPSDAEHMLDRYARLAAALGAGYDPAPGIRLDAADMSRAREILGSLRGASPDAPQTRWIAIHPGNFKKFDNRWPEGNFVELTRRLAASGNLRMVYLSGPGEDAQVADIVSHIATPLFLLPAMPLGITAAFLSLMDLAILNVTGTAHLAVAVGTPTFTLRSRYTDTVWMPRRPPHYAVVSDTWESCRNISVDSAWRILADVLKTLPRRLAAAGQ